MLTPRSLEIAAMAQVFNGCSLAALVLTFLFPVVAWCDSPITHDADYLRQRQVAQEKYEKSMRLCYQKFAVSDCKQDATGVLNAELSPLKKSEAEQMQKVRAQNTQEKMQNLAKKAPTFSNDVTDKSVPLSLTDVQTPLPTKKMTAADPGAGTNLKSPQEEHAQRKRFEEKQVRAQQHREAVEKRWVDKKGLISSEISTPP